jgi:molybdate transport system substrate-binding protein
MGVVMRTRRLLALLVVLLGGIPTAGRAEEITVSVAISMKDALERIGRGFAETRPGVRLRYNFGSSGELAKQIEAGAPVDVFVSAARRHMDDLEQKRLIDPATRRVFARNVLVVVTPSDSRLDLAGPADLVQPRVRRIVIGNPRTVPAGQYAEESLRALGLWERLRPRLVLAENARQALEYVARGEVDAGFVYATDAALRPGRVTEAFRPADDTYGPVSYPVAAVADTTHPGLARAFIDALVGPEGRRVLAGLGFLAPTTGARR